LARPFRYTVIVGLVALGAALSAVGGWRYARASAPVSGPIVLLSIDALRADRLPVYGYHNVQTPAIDALARDGVVFERAYSHAPQTLPAHASMLSGRLPYETGVRDTAGFTVSRDERLLAEILGDRGYATGGVVSSYALRASTGIAQGFSFFDDDFAAEPGDAKGRVERDGADSVASAEEWLESVGTERAFLFLHLNEPHSPYAAPERFAAHEPYDAEVAYADELVGDFIKYLKAHQLYDQSTIILSADHGEGLGDDGETGHAALPNEGALRIPLIIKPAAGKGAGRRITALVQHVDIVPTILDLAKAPAPDKLAGQSLGPLLEGSSGTPDRVVYSESLFAAYRRLGPAVQTVTDGRFRLIRADDDRLHDVVEDPAGRRDISSERPLDLSRLRAALERMVADIAAHAPSAEKPVVRTRLAALGYVGTVVAIDHDGNAQFTPAQRIEIVEAHRAAVAQAGAGEWAAAIHKLEILLRQHPQLADVWHELGEVAMIAGRFERAADAYRRAAALRPGHPEDHLHAAAALLRLRRLDDARQHAEAVIESVAVDDRVSRAAAHELLARIALARRDAGAARIQADLAREADAALPLPAFVEGRLLLDAARLEAAVPVLQAAVAESEKSGGPMLADLHYHIGDALIRLSRFGEAEYHLMQELRFFPHHVRARTALATLYQQSGRADEADEVLTTMLRVSPTPEAFAAAARLWTTFGNPSQAAAARAEAARVSAAEPRRPGSSTQ
jgi:arylsulfatase A-like enzyme/tetratricopeptide (TPR) repeat protein